MAKFKAKKYFLKNVKDKLLVKDIKPIKEYLMLVNQKEISTSSVNFIMCENFKGFYFRTSEFQFLTNHLDTSLKRQRKFFKKPNDAIFIPMPLSFIKGIFGMLFNKDEVIHTQSYELKEHLYGLQLTKEGSTLSTYRTPFIPIDTGFLKALSKINRKGYTMKLKALSALLLRNISPTVKRLTASHLVTIKEAFHEDYTSALSIRLLHLKRIAKFCTDREIKKFYYYFDDNTIYINLPNTYISIDCLETPLD